MKKDFVHLSTKQKCALLLLACLDWGCHPRDHKDIEEKIRKRLKLQYSFDPSRLRSCIDLITDTEDAICYFSKFGLQKFSIDGSNESGELYLKFYGVLNAVFQQIYCIAEIYEVCKIHNKSDALKKLKALKIYELRNIAGSHTINYEDKAEYTPENFKRNFFRITSIQLTSKGTQIHAVDGFQNLREYNLYELIMDYNIISEEILYDACLRYMDSIFLNVESERNKLLSHYELEHFKNYDYRLLNENDKLLTRYLKRIRSKIDRNFKA
jgi:hypothetical protein